MEEGYIRLFCSNLIAVYRPNKRTYSILQYVGTRWKRLHIDPAILPTIARSEQDIPNAPVKISIDAHALVNCIAKGVYFMYGEKVVTVIEKLRHSPRNFPQSFYSEEFTISTTVQRPGTEPLWTLYPAPVPLLAPMPALAKIPQRIAWIIAEDASKNNQDCPISLNPISPITSSVTNCFHVFETESILEAIRTTAKCPVCRAKNPVITACFTN